MSPDRTAGLANIARRLDAKIQSPRPGVDFLYGRDGAGALVSVRTEQITPAVRLIDIGVSTKSNIRGAYLINPEVTEDPEGNLIIKDDGGTFTLDSALRATVLHHKK